MIVGLVPTTPRAEETVLMEPTAKYRKLSQTESMALMEPTAKSRLGVRVQLWAPSQKYSKQYPWA
jgi:hypothetical protein